MKIRLQSASPIGKFPSSRTLYKPIAPKEEDDIVTLHIKDSKYPCKIIQFSKDLKTVLVELLGEIPENIKREQHIQSSLIPIKYMEKLKRKEALNRFIAHHSS